MTGAYQVTLSLNSTLILISRQTLR